MPYLKALLLNLLGFSAFLLFFAGVNFVAAQLNTTCGPFGTWYCGDVVQRVGFPLVFMELGGLPTPPGTSRPAGSMPAFLFDLGVGLVGSVLTGATCQYYFGQSKGIKSG